METSEDPDVVIARQLLDQATLFGFTFQRAVPGIDAALVGHRVSENWIDLIHIEGFSGDCSAWREWTSSLIVSPDELGHRPPRGAGQRPAGAQRGPHLGARIMTGRFRGIGVTTARRTA